MLFTKLPFFSLYYTLIGFLYSMDCLVSRVYGKVLRFIEAMSKEGKAFNAIDFRY